MELGATGVWSGPLRRHQDAGERADAAAELEDLGYGTLWIPGGRGGDILDDCEVLLGATSRAVVAVGILNIWMHDPAEVAVGHHRLADRWGHRFLLGLGISHVELVGKRYMRPYSAMVEFIDALDQAQPRVPADERIIAALGPRMLGLCAERSLGTHPYNTMPSHTREAREVLGPGPIVAPEQAVVLETDPATARAVARESLANHLTRPNYINQWRRHGFTDDDLRDGGSDRLIDALVAWGDEEAIRARVQEHRAAGADHVCVQVFPGTQGLPRESWRRLAAALIDR
ncbi:MAG: LLM class F420-dependent oxidoreductase [Actinomycetota bacterium]|nr:LLM class F420-dependent oxidoreductase [Actinomycetota bacterium]